MQKRIMGNVAMKPLLGYSVNSSYFIDFFFMSTQENCHCNKYCNLFTHSALRNS